MTGESNESQLISSAAFSLPRHVVKDLLATGICGRCIFRLFGIAEPVCASSTPSTSSLSSLHEDPETCQNTDNGFNIASHDSKGDPLFCSICLGVLQFAFKRGEERISVSDEGGAQMDEFVSVVVESVKKEGHQVDSFSLEVSVPPIILDNEEAVRLYLKRKYGSEDWFQDKSLTGHVSVKDCLKLSLTESLETSLGVKSGLGSLRIRLSYSHSKESVKLRNCDDKDSGFKRRKTGNECTAYSNSEPDGVIHKIVDGTLTVSLENSVPPLEKVSEPCQLTFNCYRTPLYIGGRYLKFSRNVSQTCWIIDDERMGEASVEEIIGTNILPFCRGDTYKFHAAGREDIDVRMLGSGRPFLIEVINPRCVPTSLDIDEMQGKINNLEGRFVEARKLKVVGSEVWTLMREGESEKQKQYAALVWISRPLMDEDLLAISAIKDMEITQRTPVRVLHRRSPLERKRIIHWMKVERVTGNCHYFLLHLCTQKIELQAGTYIKEFVHGDLGRTHPSIGTMLGCRAEIMQLDVTDVKMESFN